jgi:hypothetical protein
LKTSYVQQVKHFPWIEKHLDKAEADWRASLLTNSVEIEQYEHHILFFDFIKETTSEVPEKFQWYTMRATDSTLASNQEVVFAMTHFPQIFFVSSIFPLSLSGLKNSRINKTGKINMKWEIQDVRFGSFLVNRMNELGAEKKLSSYSENKIIETMMKDPERALKSDTLRVAMEESKRKRQEKIIEFPKGIQFLVDIIHRSAKNSAQDAVGQGRASVIQDAVADALTNISFDNAKIIDALVESTIKLVDSNHRQEFCDFETKDLRVRFMVHVCDKKDEQINLLEKAMDDLIKTKNKGDKRISVVFSYNPQDEIMPFETSFYAD